MTDVRQALVVFARVPEAGRVKTRLAAGIGADGALSAYVTLAERVIGSVRRSAAYDTTVAFTPADGEPRMREWLGAVRLRAQVHGDLGERMAAAAAAAFQDGAHRVAIVGTDCPDVTAAIVEEAFGRLASADVVLGPATDGGYWLVGMRGPHPGLFEAVPWSSPRTLQVTLERARTLGLSVALLDERRDVDTADDWHDWLARSAHSPGT